MAPCGAPPRWRRIGADHWFVACAEAAPTIASSRQARLGRRHSCSCARCPMAALALAGTGHLHRQHYARQ
eukprot:6740842-Lingulodinium_polyedra.AAC.1